MKYCFQSSISALAMSALVMGGIAVATVGITAAPAYSQNSNANSNSSNNNRNANRDRGSRNNNGGGSTASSLGALNAAHANANALANASNNSRVGMIAIYKAAVMATAEAEGALKWFEDNCETPVDATIEAKCTALLDAATAEALKAAIEEFGAGETVDPVGYDAYVIMLKAEIESLDGFENEALELAANKETSEKIIAALWELLELPSD